MYYMFLYIFYNDKRIEKKTIKRFSDLSQTKSKFYYYEEPNDIKGKGTTFKREDISCFEISPYPLYDWDEEIEKQCTTD